MNAPLTSAEHLARFQTMPDRLAAGRLIERMPWMQPGLLVDLIRAAAEQLSAYQPADEILFICDDLDREMIAEDEGQNATPGYAFPAARGA